MRQPKDSSLIAIGRYNYRNRTMTSEVYSSDNKKVLYSHNISGGTKEIADFLAACMAFKILDASIETENEYSLIYIADWNTLREVRAANCVSGLYLEMYNFEEIIEHLESGMDFLDGLGLQTLKETTAMWDKTIMGRVDDFLDNNEN